MNFIMLPLLFSALILPDLVQAKTIQLSPGEALTVGDELQQGDVVSCSGPSNIIRYCQCEDGFVRKEQYLYYYTKNLESGETKRELLTWFRGEDVDSARRRCQHLLYQNPVCNQRMSARY